MIKNNARLRTRGVTPVLALVMTCLPWVSAVAIDEHANGTSMVASALSGPVRDVYHRLPLHFEANQGQTDKQVDFVAHGSGYTLFVTPTEAVWAFHNQPSSRISRQTNPQKPQQSTGAVLRMRLVGAAPQPHVTPLEALPGKVNYFIGNDPTQWRTNIPTYAKIQYEEVYPGVDLVYYGNQQQVEYDFVVAPGADLHNLKLGFDGAETLQLDAEGNLVFSIGSMAIQLHRPLIYQEIDGSKQNILGRYVLQDKDTISFEVARYDASKPLVIDPIVNYLTLLGGTSGDCCEDTNIIEHGRDSGFGIVADNVGNAYVTGGTSSTNFPSTAGVFQPALRSSEHDDVFVTKINPTGTALLFSTYLGGGDHDDGFGIAVGNIFDPTNPNLDHFSVFVTGWTASTNFPITADAFQSTKRGGYDAFVAELNETGSQLIYSTYLGGDGDDRGNAIAIDSVGRIVVTGSTKSANFPTTPNAIQSNAGGLTDAFVVSLPFSIVGTGSVRSLDYSTFLGGSGTDEGHGITITLDTIYVTGGTNSTDFPTSPDAFQRRLGGQKDCFVTKIDLPFLAWPSRLRYSTYLGGSGNDECFGMARYLGTTRNTDTVYVTGSTDSPNFPEAHYTRLAGETDAFVASLDTSASSAVTSAYLGGNARDIGYGIQADRNGNMYVTGETQSLNSPTTPDAFQVRFSTAFLTKIDSLGELVYSTFIGGNLSTVGYGLGTFGGVGDIYVVGFTNSTLDFPTTPGAFQRTRGGTGDAFVAQFSFGVADLAVTISVSPDQVAIGNDLTYVLTVSNAGPDPATRVRLIDTLMPEALIASVTPRAGTCAQAAQTVTCDLGDLAVGTSTTVTIVVTPTAVGTIVNTAKITSNESDPVTANNTARQNTQVMLPYAAKFVCGKSAGRVVAQGTYFTAINVHGTGSV